MSEMKSPATKANWAKCPICANAPATHGDDYGDIHIYCCDMHTTSGRMWNKYVAAMTAERRLAELKEAVRWEVECADGFSENGWGFWLEDDANEELCATYYAAWREVEELI